MSTISIRKAPGGGRTAIIAFIAAMVCCLLLGLAVLNVASTPLTAASALLDGPVDLVLAGMP